MLCIVPGVGFLFLVLVFLLGALGDILDLVAVWLLLDSFVPGLRRWMTTQMAKLNCCRAVGVEQQGDAI